VRQRQPPSIHRHGRTSNASISVGVENAGRERQARVYTASPLRLFVERILPYAYSSTTSSPRCALEIPIGHCCGGFARCTTCRVEFDSEPDTMTRAEYAILSTRELLGKARLSWQIVCDHDLAVHPLIQKTIKSGTRQVQRPNPWSRPKQPGCPNPISRQKPAADAHGTVRALPARSPDWCAGQSSTTGHRRRRSLAPLVSTND
jgi:hypothetical protein